MSFVHVHLLLNHIPIVGTVLGLILVIFAIWRKSNDLKKASLALFVLLAAISIPVYFSGEPAEESVENLPGVSKAIIEQHEEIAMIAFIGAALLGVIALFALVWFRRQSLPPWVMGFTLLICIFNAGLMAYTGYLGGQIRHSEIRGGSSGIGTDTGHQNEDDH